MTQNLSLIDTLDFSFSPYPSLPSRDARDHGLQSVGLPSRLADFREVPASEDDKKVSFAVLVCVLFSWVLPLQAGAPHFC